MSNYTKSTNFATKDNLSPGNPLKIVKGTEIDTEFNNIQTAVATKTDNASAAITGGSITGITDLAVADGGTGASTATAALNNLLPTQTGNANKYLQTDGTNATWDAVSLSTSDITGTLPVANGGTGVTTSTGTGNVVLSNSPTLVTPALGTPASGTATNLTGLPISTGVSGLGSNVATFLATPSSANLASAVTDETGSGALVFANSPTLVTPALGTPSSATLTNATGLPISTGVSGLGTGVATFLGTPSSANLLAAVSDETGTGALVFATSPTLVTPALGTPASGVATNLTGLPLSTGVTGTLPVLNGGTGVTTSTGSGNNVLSTSPTLVTPILGTPTSATLTNATGLPLSTGVTGTLPVANGGTGQTSYTDGQLLIGNSTGNTLTKATLTQGSGITITNSAGAITIAASGGGGSGDVVGPASATDNALVRFDTTTGKLVQNSVGILSDAGVLTGLTGLTSSGSVTLSGLTSGRVPYASTGGLLADSANLLYSGTDLTVYGLTVGRGASALATNTAMGVSALSAATTGDVNTALGYEALAGATTSGANTAVGYRALKAASTGDGNNTGVGTLALAANTTGSFNTATGRSALLTNTTGTSNSAYGVSALNTNLSGASNVAVGREALYSNTTSSNNTVLGYQAMYSYQTGGDNVAVGTQAGYTINGNGNATFVGRSAGYSTTGGNSTFVGYQAGYYVSTGAKNTIVGLYNGNQDSLDIRTLSNYVVLSDGDGNRQITMKEGQTLALDSAVPNAGTGITFPATQSASSDANTLDDYEEGSFTPTIIGGTTAGTASYSTRTARYTKIGRVVQFDLYISWTSGTGTGNLRVDNLPFTSNNTTYQGVTLSYPNNLALTASNVAVAFIGPNSGYIDMYQYPVGGGASTTISYDASGEIMLSGTYSI